MSSMDHAFGVVSGKSSQNPKRSRSAPMLSSRSYSLYYKWHWKFAPTYKRKNLDTDLIPFTKIDSKWVLDLNLKYKMYRRK